MSTNKEETLRQFCDVTGADEGRSKFFLESSNWQLDVSWMLVLSPFCCFFFLIRCYSLINNVSHQFESSFISFVLVSAALWTYGSALVKFLLSLKQRSIVIPISYVSVLRINIVVMLYFSNELLTIVLLETW